MNGTAKQRAACLILDILSRTAPVIPHTWSRAEVDEVMLEVGRIEAGLRLTAIGRDLKATRAMTHETGHQVRLRNVKGVKR